MRDRLGQFCHPQYVYSLARLIAPLQTPRRDSRDFGTHIINRCTACGNGLLTVVRWVKDRMQARCLYSVAFKITMLWSCRAILKASLPIILGAKPSMNLIIGTKYCGTATADLYIKINCNSLTIRRDLSMSRNKVYLLLLALLLTTLPIPVALTKEIMHKQAPRQFTLETGTGHH